jgi:hypothetical protein
LKKSAVTYDWDEACNEAFEMLKGILVEAPMLKLPDFDKDLKSIPTPSTLQLGVS